MTLIDIIKMAASNLWRRKMRTMLTVFGVIIGTACIVIMVALGIGNMEQFQQSIMESSSLTKIEVSSYSSSEGGITDATIDEFKAIEGVKSATPVISLPAYFKIGKYTSEVSVYCVDPNTMDFKFSQGKMFSENSAQPEFIIGSNAKNSFMDSKMRDTIGGYGSDGTGKTVYFDMNGNEIDVAEPDINFLEDKFTYYPAYQWDVENRDAETTTPMPKEYKVKFTGILEQSDSEESYNIYTSLETGRKIIKENRELMKSNNIVPGKYMQAFVYVNSIDDAKSVLDEIKAKSFEAYSTTEWITSMQEESQRQQSQLTAIGLISLLVSAIGIANTMLASILERRREIGVMKVIGLSVAKINLMFLVEAALIGLIGGGIGLGISYGFAGFLSLGGAGEDVSFLGMYFSNGVTLSIPIWLALGAIAIAAGTGILSGIYPAWRATKLSPLEAIRSGE